MSDPDFVQAAEPEEAFGALADETRVEIIRALWEADESSLSFSALRETVGMRDSGQFNYHLDKLTDRFVRKTGEGYHLTLAGQLVNGAIYAGAFTMDGSIDSMELDEPCPSCGGTRTFRYEDETVEFSCSDCDHLMSMGVPPGVLDGIDEGAVPDVASRYLRTVVQHVGNGFCWFCDGQIETDLVAVAEFADGDPEEIPWDTDLPIAVFECQRRPSAFPIQVDLGSALLDHPQVAAFFADHDVDTHGPDWWQYSVLDPDEVYFVDEAESRARVHYSLDDERLRVEVDEDLTVLETERLPA